MSQGAAPVSQPVSRKARSPRQVMRRKSAFDHRLRPEALRALAEPTRASLLSCLLKCGRACTVTEIAECCELDFSMVARHLSTLAKAGLAASEKRGRMVYYTADAEGLAAWFRELAASVDVLAERARACDDACGDGCGCGVPAATGVKSDDTDEGSC